MASSSKPSSLPTNIDVQSGLPRCSRLTAGGWPLQSETDEWRSGTRGPGSCTTTWQAVAGFGADSLVFTPDSNFLITGGAGEAAIWNVQQGGSGGVQVAVDPSGADARVLVGVKDVGRTLITYTDGTGVRDGMSTPERLLEQACAVAGRDLTQEEWSEVLPDQAVRANLHRPLTSRQCDNSGAMTPGLSHDRPDPSTATPRWRAGRVLARFLSRSRSSFSTPGAVLWRFRR